MSTSAAIIMKTATGYAGIYCHSDGYKEHTGKILKEHYSDAAKVEKLIALGDISVLYPLVDPTGEHSYDKREKGVTVAYGRDRGEEGMEPMIADTIEELKDNIDDMHVYVFDGSWTYNCQPL